MKYILFANFSSFVVYNILRNKILILIHSIYNNLIISMYNYLLLRRILKKKTKNKNYRLQKDSYMFHA